MNEEKSVKIDYLSGTWPLVTSEYEDEQERSEFMYRVFRDFFRLDNCQCRRESYATNNFKYQYTLGEFITLRTAGPIDRSGYRTCQLELKGEGCREFERRREDITWIDFFNFLYGLDISYKRIDIALDDFSGMEIDQAYIYEKIKKGEYTSSFKSAPKLYGGFESVQTIELGSRNSPIQLCIYNKKAEQEAQKNIVDETYWVRYELRFRKAKADSVVLALCRDYQNSNDDTYRIDLAGFARAELYTVLDIKEASNGNRGHQYREETDPKWLAFLDNSEKAELPKALEHESNYQTRRKYIMPKAAGILMLWLEMCNNDKELYLHDLLDEVYKLTGEFNSKQKKRYSEFRVENGLPAYTEDEFQKAREALFSIKEEMELPF